MFVSKVIALHSQVMLEPIHLLSIPCSFLFIYIYIRYITCVNYKHGVNQSQIRNLKLPGSTVFVAKAIKVAVTLLPSPQLHDSPSYFLGGGPGSTQGLLMKRQRKSWAPQITTTKTVANSASSKWPTASIYMQRM